MRKRKGGTWMFCPQCQEVTVCAAVPTTNAGLPSGQRWHRTDHADVQWFRRARKCKSCQTTFVTAEMGERLLEELVELRNALATIKQNAETYVNQSQAAAESLAKLTASLEVLRALKMYEQVQPGQADF